jgi:hypothetical protein
VVQSDAERTYVQSGVFWWLDDEEVLIVNPSRT